MTIGEHARRAGSAIAATALGILGGIAALPQAALAQVAEKATEAAATATAAAGSYVPMKPVPGIGQPVDGAFGFQQQFSPNGHYALWMHDAILMPIITIITLFVLLLLVIVAARFNKRANPVASRTSHNTLIEVVWTLVPVLILVGIAIPSITLLARQYKPAPENALTVKATGNQWFWTYSYPDNGGLEVISNMLPDDEAVKRGEPAKLGVDNRLVLPVGEPIRLQTVGADVIHSFAVPSLWFKLDAVPGRVNEKVLTIEKPGVYYGQCSELCGARHGYMPIAIEALPRDKFNAWVLSQGGQLDHQKKPAAAAAAAPAAAAAAPAAAAPAASEAAAPAATESAAPAA
ncbi:cytochrome c oxidase subunit II [Novosphingobium bradum]|uniref:Cytochrome c oxidase subunit 2 n=1 Tax=Novosphingobium bradum TaxID=1737444 RepID=A0ABV7INH2_9SPHN